MCIYVCVYVCCVCVCVCLSVCLLYVRICIRVHNIYILLLGNTVLVHGGGGRDLTLLATSLAQVLLDPHCRTVTG